MSKAHDPHWRYIAFKVDGPRLGRHAVKMGLEATWKAANVDRDLHPLLTRYEYPHGIVRIHHHQVELTRALLPKMRAIRDRGQDHPVTIATLGTSGTIMALTKRLQILTARPPRPERSAKA